MILINPKIKCKVEKKICDKNGRCIILDILIADTRNVLANIYAPNDANQQISFFKEIQQLQEFSEEIIIIGGDFNCSLAEKYKKVAILTMCGSRKYPYPPLRFFFPV